MNTAVDAGRRAAKFLVQSTAIVGLSLGALLVTGCSSTPSGDAAAQTVASSSGAAPDPNDKVRCKTITPIGTKIGQRVCKKQSEWIAEEGGGSELAREVQRRAAQGNPIGN